MGSPGNASKRAFRWRADDGPALITDLVALRFFMEIRSSTAKKDFSGESRHPVPTSGSANAAAFVATIFNIQ